MMRCEYCGAFIPDKGKFCLGCGAAVCLPDEKKSKKSIPGKLMRKLMIKFLALMLYLILSIVHMIVLFGCVYGGMILSGLSVASFIGALGTILLMYMEPELGYGWDAAIPCFVASFLFMFLPLVGEGLSEGIECLKGILMDVIRR